MRVIIIGAGEVGQNIARTLSVEGQDVTLVDGDGARVMSLVGQIDAQIVRGNGASPRFLEAIEAGKADLLLAVTQVDEVNVIAAMAGHNLGAKRTVARVRDAEYFGSSRATAHDVLGIDFVIHPERAVAEDLAEAIMVPGAVHVEYFGIEDRAKGQRSGRMAIAEVVISDSSPLAGKPLGEVVRPHPLYVVGYTRGGEPRATRGDTVLVKGDHALVAASNPNLRRGVAWVAGRARPVKDVVIFGGGRIGLALAHYLERQGDFHIVMMEHNEERARIVAEKLSRTMVLHEEGVSKEVLIEHGVDQAGAFVACAGDDRTNLLASMHAKQLGADLVMSVVSREEYTPLVSGLGIDSAFSPRLATAEEILRFVRGETVQHMHLMVGGAELIEMKVRAGSTVAGVPMRACSLPKGCEIAALLRGDEVLMPSAAESIFPEDRVLLFGMPGASAKLQGFFSPL